MKLWRRKCWARFNQLRRHGRTSILLALTFISFCILKLAFHKTGNDGYEYWLPLPRGAMSLFDDLNDNLLESEACRTIRKDEISAATVKAAKVEIDTREVFAGFNFKENRTGNASSWFYNDPFFETRYKDMEEQLVRERPPLKVILMMWSHLDPGWRRTYDDYQYDANKIYSGFIKRVEGYPNISFTTAEISFFSRFFDSCDDVQKAYVRKVVDSKRLEFATGGWVMTDEAVVSLYSMVDQLIEGHTWLKANLNYTPRSGWSVDPFGHGATLPYLLSSSGITQTVIQRIHYNWKDYFARNQVQDFLWRQWWDPRGKSDCLTHNMPYNIYSIESTCGPFQSICEYFDFRSVGQITPYAMKHTPITGSNVKHQSEELLKMYRRTASLLEHNVLLQPLGDDFRYDFNVEFDQQYRNYDAIAEFFKANPQYRVEMSFGTLSDYFDALKERSPRLRTLEGDFFPYAHKPDDHWTGYFSTRPFWKVTARELEAELRAAEILFTLALSKSPENGRTIKILSETYDFLVSARQALGLFQHHDGITGTSTAHVMADYGKKMHKALSDARKVQVKAAALFVDAPDHNGASPGLATMKMSALQWNRPSPIRCLNLTANPELIIGLFNPLAQRRVAVTKLCLTASEKFTLTSDAEDVDLPFQINPLSAGADADHYVVSSTWHEVEFLADVGPLEFAFYRLKKASKGSSVQLEHSHIQQDYAKLRSHYKLNTVVLRAGQKKEKRMAESHTAVTFGGDHLDVGQPFSITNALWELEFDYNKGLPIRIKDRIRNQTHTLKMELLAYEPVPMESGAYSMKFFKSIPEEILAPLKPHSVVTEGRVESSVRTTYGEFANFTFTLHQVADLAQAIHFQITLDLWRHPQSLYQTRVIPREIFLRIKTDLVGAGPHYYTDSAGFQMIKRTAIPSLDAAANYYPMTSAFYIQDRTRDGYARRATFLSGQSHGVTAAGSPGVMDVMLERTAQFDDKKGMGEGVEDSKRTNLKFAFLLERSNDQAPVETDHKADTSGDRLLSPLAAMLARHLNNPVVGFLSASKGVLQRFPWARVGPLTAPFPCNVHLLTLRADFQHAVESNVDQNTVSTKKAVIILHHEGVNGNFGCIPPRCGQLAKEGAVQVRFSHQFPVLKTQKVSLTGLLQHGNSSTPTDGAARLACEVMQLCSFRLTF